MKRIFLTVLAVSLFISCKQESKKVEEVTAKTSREIEPISDEVLETAVIYEANIRQYSEDGTFDSFTADMPKLKELGVKIIWLMPVHPISVEKRKAKGDLFVSDIENPEERKKYLGSYYSVADYKKVNPEFGTMEDFDELIAAAHENGIYVILDWVPNHTGWDHPWIKEHPDYYTQDEKGNIVDPIDPSTGESWGWTDVADLNYDNQEMRKAMIGEMAFWLKEHKVDGFRCDVAHGVPADFWSYATRELNQIKPVFMLAEAESAELMKNGFDMQYAWEAHHIMNDIAKGEKTVSAWDEYMVKIDSVKQADDIYMYFTSNHDENTWAGTVFDRMGNAAEVFAALSYCVPGMPLIYNGQEYDMNKRLRFFEKDTIIREKGKFFPVYEKFGKLKNEKVALNGGKKAASYSRIKTSDDESILALEREKAGEKLVFIANLTKEPKKFTLEHEGTFTNYLSGEEFNLNSGQEYELAAWEYLILVKDK
ncbi:alpha-amylase family glycosyl hydrolase [Abyssalbus ytuae]|uniref:Alpha-amylase family glycosyl hydrolase n=1 Tax=Abyssalbus ytuae TaxID=2926907 RepID=A0A9E7D4D2_9FLAO|nr:alpha-amylase family glycosyl hydrolase [Abyssalbus ytuae]UOB18789.1 alpha-amylase family glycosyl hydrolase [Abyssalbus ytuae]